MKKKIKQDTYQWIFRFLIFMVIVGSFIAFLVLPDEKDSTFELAGEEENVTIEYSGEFFRINEQGEREQIEVPGKYPVPTGEVFVVETTLPEDFQASSIVVRSSQQDMKIYLDGKLRVDYNTQETRPVGSQTTSRYVFCKTSREDAGAVLRIETVSDTSEYSGVINQVYACDKFDFWTYVIRKDGKDTWLGLFIICIGLFTIAASIALSIALKEKNDMEFIGWCVLLAGCWLVGESKLRQLLWSNASIVSNLCFVAIMLAPLPLFIYLNSVQENRYRKIYSIAFGIGVADFLLSNLIQILNIADYVDFVYIPQIVLILSFLVVILTFYLDFRKGYIHNYKDICLGLLILMCIVGVEVVRMYFVTMLSGVYISVGVFILVGTVFIKTLRDMRAQEALRQEERLREQKEQSDLMSMEMIQTLSNALEAKDEYTKGHSFRVASYAKLLAQRAGLDEEAVSKIHYAATLHDIGKIGIPDTILSKPTRLTEEEFAIIKTHTVIGADILKNVELIAYTEKIARYHHERYDGKGYPQGLAGEEIPYEARIVALADSYDAMNSKRVYRSPLQKEAIRNEIKKNRGQQFDPELTDLFLQLLDEGLLEQIDENDAKKSISSERESFEGNSEATELFSIILDTMNNRANGEENDYLTGLLLRGAGEKRVQCLMRKNAGALIFLDMDNLKKINDIHGHKAGDRALRHIGEILTEAAADGIASRMGGDEFVLFLAGYKEADAVAKVEEILECFIRRKDQDIQLEAASLSAGICMCEIGEAYSDALSKADKALYYVKHRGKAGYHVYNAEKNEFGSTNSKIDLEQLISSIRKYGKYKGALEVEYREFAKLYEYIGKLCERYKHSCQLTLITMDMPQGDNVYIDEMEQAMQCMEIAIRDNIRNVDVCTRYSSVQFLVILIESGEDNIDMIMQRIFSRFHKICPLSRVNPSYETKEIIT